ncbi:MAG: FAD-dependent oxidoreductase [Bryobacteraceae bacterium]|jgi:heterodisulfide reductase subunit A-like polyferredoxin
MIAHKQNAPDAPEAVGAVLVCGAGITGIQASLDLAESGFKVYLLDSSPAIGGRMAQLDKTFPTGDCAMCILSPKLVECARNKNIEIVTLADVEGISGEPGNFKVKIRQNPRYVAVDKCNACGECTEACPVSLANEFDRNLGTRKAIFRPYPQAIPNVFGISKAAGTAPCKSACPAGVNAQGYVALVAAGKFREAYELIRQRCPLPAACGRVCQHPCEDHCNRREIDEPVAVRDLKRFVADYIHANPEQYPPAKAPAARLDAKVAVIGGGPAGLTVASDLALLGYGITLFEAQPRLGGMLRYGIPDYRLPGDVLDREIQYILDLGVEAKTGARVADPKSLLKPAGAFDAVFAAPGAWLGRKMGIPGENAEGVWEALDFLYQVNNGKPPAIGPHVVVIGGGDVAMDAARCARRLPGVQSVRVAYRRSRREMPAHPWEVAEALEEGVILHPDLGPARIESANGKVSAIAFHPRIGGTGQTRQTEPRFDESQTIVLAADTIIVAIGQAVDSAGMGVATGASGRITAGKGALATSVPGIFAGGDAVLGPSSIADAMGQGHIASQAIDAYLRGGRLPAEPEASEPARNPAPGAPRVDRVRMAKTGLATRQRAFDEINRGYTAEQAIAEARRCLACGLCSECMECVKVCSPGAIWHEQRASERQLDVGSVILTPGFEEFQASLRGEFGHGRYANVLSSVQFERMLSAAGPTGGVVERPSDGGAVHKIAFIQCVGSRDAARGNGYCSSICCMSAAKEAMVALEHAHGGKLEISIFCMDVRAFGKEFDSYVNRARDEHGVKFIRAIPSRVLEMPGSKTPRIRYFDQEGVEQQQDFDLVVLSVGLRPSSAVEKLAGRLGVDLNEFGFSRTGRLSPLATSRPGIYVAGAFQEPKDIPESVAQASGAAACAMGQLAPSRGALIQRHSYPWERDVTDEAPRVGVFICHCGHNIASVVDVKQVAGQAARMDGVRHAEANLYTCSDTSQQHIKDMIVKHRLNRLVVSSCSPRTHEALFQETLRESGLNQYLFAMTNIRDQCSWVHKDVPEAATRKALELTSMAIARARRLKALPTGRLPVTASALVIGGGLAGMTAALGIADQGFEVHLAEKEPHLGGLLRHVRSTLEGADVQAYLNQLVARVQSHHKIRLHVNTTVAAIGGHVGNFRTLLNVAGHETPISHGVVVVAAGGRRRTTDLYLHGRNPHVTTQAKLHESLGAGAELLPELAGKPDPTVVMIQCVESRNDQHPYCSRICCSEAVQNALEIKRRLPLAKVAVLARDIRTYGFRETYFQKAREAGVLFIRYPDGSDPVVAEENGRLKVTVRDRSTGRDLVLRPDLLALATGIAPASGNPALSGLLRSALTSDGFFLEAHPKLRPVDLANEGEFLCGLAHSPRLIDETIAQAQAAAGRAATILSKTHLEIPGQVARVNPENCVACATCVKLCPYGAPTINDLKKAEIQGAKCMGCGSCAAACPARAIVLQHQEDPAMVAMLDELLAAGVNA